MAQSMQEVKVDASATHGGEVKFMGRPIAGDRVTVHGFEIVAYLTQHNRIAIVDHTTHSLYDYDSLEELKRSTDPAWTETCPEMIQGIQQQVGGPTLDI
jgi:hypothetical protein